MRALGSQAPLKSASHANLLHPLASIVRRPEAPAQARAHSSSEYASPAAARTQAKVVALEKRAALSAREAAAARAEGVDALRDAERRIAEAERRVQVSVLFPALSTSLLAACAAQAAGVQPCV